MDELFLEHRVHKTRSFGRSENIKNKRTDVLSDRVRDWQRVGLLATIKKNESNRERDSIQNTQYANATQIEDERLRHNHQHAQSVRQKQNGTRVCMKSFVTVGKPGHIAASAHMHTTTA